MDLHPDPSLIANQIIPAKISLPYQQRGVIQREQLRNLLEGAFTHRLTLVCAPAGYGKTTLVSNWVANQKSPVAWLSLTQEDNQVPVFLSYLSAALKKANPSFGNCVEEALHQGQVIHIPSLGRTLLQEMDQVIPGMLLVLDDFHLIQNPQIHELIRFLLQNCSSWIQTEGTIQGVHLILISRTEPPFSLAKWRLHQELIEIGIDQLKFSLAETEEFLKKANQPELLPDKIQNIADRTEGWVTGLQLTLLGMKASAHPRLDHPEIHANNQLLVDYLLEEVIQDLPEGIQEFLLQTSILEHLTADLCDQIRGKQDSQQILEWLDRENLFILPMDSQQGWYRYHQLLRDVLIQRQHLLGKDVLAEYHTRAAIWLETKGYIQESLLQWLAADNLGEAARMIAKDAPHLLYTSQYSMLKELLDHFSEDAFQRYPWLCIYRAWSYIVIAEYSLTQWLDQAMEIIHSEECNNEYSEAEIHEMEGNICTIWALHKTRHGKDEETIAYAEKALRLLPANEKNVRGLALIALAKIQYRNGELNTALNFLAEARKMLQDGGNISGTTEALYLTGRIMRIKGKLKAASQYHQQAISMPPSQSWHELYFGYLSYAGMGLIEIEWNHLEQANRYFEKSYSKQNVHSVINHASIYMTRLEAKMSMLDLDDVGTIVRGLDTYLVNQMIPYFQRNEILGMLLKYYSLHHDFQISRQFIKEHKIDLVQPGDFVREYQLVGLAYFYWMSGEFAHLEILMQQFLPVLEKGGRYNRFIQMETLYALALFQAGDLKSAFRHFSNAINNGMKDDYFGSYVSFGEPMLPLIDAFIKSDELPEKEISVLSKLQEIKKVISQRIAENHLQEKTISSGKFTGVIQQEKTNVTLTLQEKLIVKYLASDNDQKAIAQALNLSIYTVKTHIYHIYDKLDVHNRMEAVLKAKTLGLL